jgi:hypothetical protein
MTIKINVINEKAPDREYLLMHKWTEEDEQMMQDLLSSNILLKHAINEIKEDEINVNKGRSA